MENENILTTEIIAIGEELRAVAEQHLTDAKAVAALIEHEQAYLDAADFLKRLKAFSEKVDARFEEARDYHDKTHKAIVALIKERKAPVDRAWDMVSLAMVAFKKKERLALEAEQARRNAEARKQEEDARLETAQALHESGDTQVAQDILNQEIVVSVPKMQEVKADGISLREGKWKARVSNKMALVLAVQKHPELLNALEIKMGWLNNQAQKLDGKMSYPGVFVEKEDPTVVVR